MYEVNGYSYEACKTKKDVLVMNIGSAWAKYHLKQKAKLKTYIFS
jgi:hypothetical protein